MPTATQLVSYDALNTFLWAKGTPLSGNRIATKAVISANYKVVESASPYSLFTSNRCVSAGNIVPFGSLLFVAYAAYYPSDACNYSGGGGYVQVYGADTSRYDSQFIAGHTYYYSDGTLLNAGSRTVYSYWIDQSGSGYNWVISSGYATLNGNC
jgi:hypothetical protein